MLVKVLRGLLPEGFQHSQQADIPLLSLSCAPSSCLPMAFSSTSTCQASQSTHWLPTHLPLSVLPLPPSSRQGKMREAFAEERAKLTASADEARREAAVQKALADGWARDLREAQVLLPLLWLWPLRRWRRQWRWRRRRTPLLTLLLLPRAKCCTAGGLCSSAHCQLRTCACYAGWGSAALGLVRADRLHILTNCECRA